MKGEVRNPMTVWLVTVATCGMYGLYFWYTVGKELKAYLGKEEINPVMDVAIALFCFPYALYIPIKYGKYIQEAQQRAGMANAEDQGMTFLIWNFICQLGLKKVQEEMNKVWEGGGGAPASF